MSEYDWQKRAECAKKEHLDKVPLFFSNKTEDKRDAKALCGVCPVRRECAKMALEERHLSGIWGGNDEVENRRTLSVNADGMEIRRGRYPRCPYCKATSEKLKTDTVARPGGGRWATMRVVICTDCEFSWASRTSANAVEAYHAAKRSGKKITED